MIHIIEINEQHHAIAWFAFDEQDLICKVLARQAAQADNTPNEPDKTLVTELRDCIAIIAKAHDFRIYPDDDTAADELDADPFFKTREGFDAGLKLRAQLVELEVIAEDF